MILAAGLGTRLSPYSRHTPKPLFTLNQRPVLDLIIDRLLHAGCEQIIINTHHLHEQIEAFVQQQQYPVPVITRHEPEILGTGGAIQNIADLWTEAPLLVFNADIVTDIDLAHVYQWHCANNAAVTMVMHDEQRFNCVCVDNQDRIVSFNDPESPCTPHRKLAFTGIHVLNRDVLNYLPPQGPAHIINAYSRMIEDGKCIKALISKEHYWQDIGTPDSYRSAALYHMARDGFKNAFSETPVGKIDTTALKGDGSDRRWYRLNADGKSLILVDHGLRLNRQIRQEVDAFMDIGHHLRGIGAAVPRIHAADTFNGMVILEDLGDLHLQQIVTQQGRDQNKALYCCVIDQWLQMAIDGSHAFNLQWTYQSTHYDEELIIEKECRYFIEAFVSSYLGRRERFDDYLEEFQKLARLAIQYGQMGFMHRDLQSRNIMINGDRICFIDFQGGRMGPLQYDLAALLIDPYVNLDNTLQDELFDYAVAAIAKRIHIDPATFQKGFIYCRLTRNLQMLGAFGFLSQVKGKKQFEAFIPVAVQTLLGNLSIQKRQFPKLAELVTTIANLF